MAIINQIIEQNLVSVLLFWNVTSSTSGSENEPSKEPASAGF
jgi:hypothetical protein